MAAPGSVTSAHTSAYQTAQEHDSSSPDPADPHSPIGFWTPAPSRLALQQDAEDEDQDDTPRAAAFQRALEEKAVEASGSSPVLLERYMDQDRTPAATPSLDVPLTRLQARLRASQASQTSSLVSTPTTSVLKIRTRSASRRARSPLPATSPLPPLPGTRHRPADLKVSSSLEQLEDTTLDETVIHEQKDKGKEVHVSDEPQTIPDDEDVIEILAPSDYVDLPKPRVVIYVPANPIHDSMGSRSTVDSDPVSKSPKAVTSRLSDQADEEKRSDHSRTSSTISKPEDTDAMVGMESVISTSTSTASHAQDKPSPSSITAFVESCLDEILVPIQQTNRALEYKWKAVFDEKRGRDSHASQRRRRQVHRKRKRMFSCANGPVYSRALF